MSAIVIASVDHDVPFYVTTLFVILLVSLVTALALEEKLHAKKSVIAGTCAIVCLALGGYFRILPFEKVVVGSHHLFQHTELSGDYLPEGSVDQSEHVDIHAAEKESRQEQHPLHVDGHRIAMPVYIPAIDWGVIAIILGSSLFVDVTSKSGLFTWIAIKVTKISGGDPLWLLTMYGVMTVVFSAVLNNVTAMIIIGSLTAVSLGRLNQRKLLLGFLLIEALLTNVGGLLTLISSVPNIIVGTAANISFITFFYTVAPYVVLATALTIWMGARLFGITRLTDQSQREQARRLVAGFDENDGIENWGFFWFGAAMLVLFIITIATTSALPVIKDLEMGFVAMAFAGIMLLQYKAVADQFYKSIDWDLLGFFMALFVVIYVMEHAQVLAMIGDGLQWAVADITAEQAKPWDAAVLLVGAAAFSSVTDNIPLAAMLANILKGLGTPDGSGLWWSVIFGANLGGNITPIGSASTLVAVTIIHKHKLALSFGAFVKLAIPYALVQLVLATVYVLLFLR